MRHEIYSVEKFSRFYLDFVEVLMFMGAPPTGGGMYVQYGNMAFHLDTPHSSATFWPPTGTTLAVYR